MNTPLIEWMGTILLLTGFLTVLFRRFWNIVACYRYQSLALGIVMITFAARESTWHLWAVAGVTILVKVILIPLWLGRVLHDVADRMEGRAYVGAAFSLFSGAGLLLLSHVIADKTYAGPGPSHADELTIALALVLLGLFQMMTRKKAISQMMGVLFIENAVTFAGLTLTGGLPIVIELGILFDVLIGLLIMSILVFRIQETFDSIDTDEMTMLHG